MCLCVTGTTTDRFQASTLADKFFPQWIITILYHFPGRTSCTTIAIYVRVNRLYRISCSIWSKTRSPPFPPLTMPFKDTLCRREIIIFNYAPFPTFLKRRILLHFASKSARLMVCTTFIRLQIEPMHTVFIHHCEQSWTIVSQGHVGKQPSPRAVSCASPPGVYRPPKASSSIAV